MTAAKPSLRFGNFVLHPGERRLLRAETEVVLHARAFDLLCVLASRAGELVTRDELLSTVWQGLVVEDANLHVQVSQVRKAIGADAIATVPGQGYRFTLPVRQGAAAPSMRRLSVVVLPFTEPGAAQGDAYFAEAITDGIAAQASRIRGSFVVNAATAQLARGAIDVAGLGRALGVRYALQGRIERDGGTVEVAVTLTDTTSLQVAWTDSVELPAGNVRTLRREVVARLVNALGLQLVHAEVRRLAEEPAAHPDAVDLVMQGSCAGGWNWSRQHYTRALELFDRALAIAPGDPEALAHRAWAYAALAAGWPGPQIARQLDCAQADALAALRGDSLDPLAHVALCVVHHQQYRLDEAVAAAETALALNPNSIGALTQRAEVHRLSGTAEEGKAYALRALELSPHDPHRYALQMRMGWLHINLGEYEEALPWFDSAYALHPHWMVFSPLIAMHAQLGHMDRVRELLPLRTNDPEIAVFSAWNRAGNHPVLLRQLRDHYFTGLVKAGVWPSLAVGDAWIARQLRGGIP